MPRGHRPPIRSVRRESVRLLALLVGVALLVGILRGGSHYLYCPFMDAVVTQDCCSRSGPEPGTITARDCCETETIGTLPSASGTAAGPQLPMLPLVAVLPAFELPGAESASFATRTVLEPTGPPPMRAAQRAARFQVFLI